MESFNRPVLTYADTHYCMVSPPVRLYFTVEIALKLLLRLPELVEWAEMVSLVKE